MTRIPAAAIVLAGGQSRRMGRDKALLRLNGETLLERTIRVVSNVAGEVLVVGRSQLPAVHLHVKAVDDDVPGAGPLGGLMTGLRQIQTGYALAVACDLPFLEPRVLAYLLSLAHGHEAAVPHLRGRSQPTHAVYAASILPIVEQRVAARQLKLDDLLRHLDVRWVEQEELEPVDPGLRSFVNTNTPDEWEAALRTPRKR